MNIPANRKTLGRARWLCAGASAICAFGASQALAQQAPYQQQSTAAPETTTGDLFNRQENVGVLDRPHPEYQAIGVRLGSWFVYPKITLETDYDDNIYAQPSGRLSDAIFNLEPGVTVQSNWGRHALGFSVDSTISRYASHSREDTEQFKVMGTGRLDVDHSFTIDGSAQYGLVTIPRSSPTYFVQTQSPLQVWVGKVSLDATKEFARFKIDASISDEQDNAMNGRLANGTPLDFSYLTHNQITGQVRVEYALDPKLAVFVQEIASTGLYAQSLRNSTSYQSLAGVDFQLTHLITARIGAGYIYTSYALPNVRPFGGPDGSIELTWYPTQLLTISVKGQEGLFDSGVPNSPASLSRDIKLQADYELLRNLIISGGFEGNWMNYRGIDRNDQVLDGRLTAKYLLNRHIGIALRYDHAAWHSVGADAGRTFDDNRIGIALTFQQ